MSIPLSAIQMAPVGDQAPATPFVPPADNTPFSAAEIADLRVRVLRGEKIDPAILRRAYDQMLSGRSVVSGTAATTRAAAPVSKAAAKALGNSLLEKMKQRVAAPKEGT